MIIVKRTTCTCVQYVLHIPYQVRLPDKRVALFCQLSIMMVVGRWETVRLLYSVMYGAFISSSPSTNDHVRKDNRSSLQARKAQ